MDTLEKISAAEGRMMSLFDRHGSLTPSEIINDLKEIRQGLGYLPGFPPGHVYDLAVYNIFQAVANSDNLTEDDAWEMAQMLAWGEYEADQSSGNILHAMERFPQKRFQKPLQEFIEKMKRKQKAEGPGSRAYADAWAGEDWAKTILAKL